ncbi:MAG: ester cyclase [Pseudomonadota bacterium]
MTPAKAAYKGLVENGYSPAAVSAFFAPDATVNVVHPFNEMSGSDVADRYLGALSRAFSGLQRTDYIFFGNGDWVTATGYWRGVFDAPFLGIAPTHALAHLRVGEFHRISGGQAVESFIYLDLPELMIAADQWPDDIASPAAKPGYTGYLPGPDSQDGLCWADGDLPTSEASLKMVTDMLLNLATTDETWRPYWHDDMVWYGPAAFGSFYGIEGFAAFQVPFEGCFSHWMGGATPNSGTRHYARFADGNYIASGGWPSLNAHQVKPFLGQPATHKDLMMRVCDWWRRDGDKLKENWVFVDIPDVLRQMGRDLFEGVRT